MMTLHACGLSTKTAITAQLAAGDRETRITEITPANPKAGDTVTMTGKRFPARTKNVIGRVVLADGGTKDSTMTVASDTSASFTVPTDTVSEVKSIIMLTTEKTYATYEIQSTIIDALTFSPAAGTFTTAQSVTISSTQTGVTIYYTTDGSVPTTNSAVYAGPISVASTTTITAYAIKTGLTDSAKATALYTITATGTASTPTMSVAAGTYDNNQSVTLTSAGADSIYYTTDGSTPDNTKTLYSGAITISATTTLQAIAIKANYSNSAIASATYTLTAATPALGVAAGTYTSAQSVTLSSTTSGAAIRYTTDGSTPTGASTLYSGAVAVSSTQTLKAIAIKAGYTNSAETSAAYVINLTTVSTPTFSPAAGGYGPSQTVVISTITAGSTIYYTTNNTTPTTSSSVYSTAITVSATQTLQAFAVKGGLIDSGVGRAIASNFLINSVI